VDLYFKDVSHLDCAAQNLSMIGMWVVGCLEQGEGSQCDIEFRDAVATSNHLLRIKGEVVRRDDAGLALLFLNMNVRAYNDLESLIFELGGPPLMEENEFLADLPA
jgi:hypothetical protein